MIDHSMHKIYNINRICAILCSKTLKKLWDNAQRGNGKKINKKRLHVKRQLGRNKETIEMKSNKLTELY